MPSKKCNTCHFEWHGGCPQYERWIDPCPDYVVDLSCIRDRKEREERQRLISKILDRAAHLLDDPETPQ